MLWDIDLTLIESGGVAGKVYASAFQAAIGRPLEHHAEMAGRTDPLIFADMLELHGIPGSDETFATFVAVLTAAYQAASAELRERGRVLPGAAEALVALASTAGVVQSVLTGNVRPVAIVKLAAFGLDRYLDVESGAFGDDDPVRGNLVAIARRRAAARHRTPFPPERTIIIGDTPHDVAAARAGGARAIAVASGRSDEEVLRAAGADVVLPNLRNTAAVLQAVKRT